MYITLYGALRGLGRGAGGVGDHPWKILKGAVNPTPSDPPLVVMIIYIQLIHHLLLKKSSKTISKFDYNFKILSIE